MRLLGAVSNIHLGEIINESDEELLYVFALETVVIFLVYQHIRHVALFQAQNR